MVEVCADLVVFGIYKYSRRLSSSHYFFIYFGEYSEIMGGEAVKRPRGRPSLNKKRIQEPVTVKAKRSRESKKDKEKEVTIKKKQNEPRKRRRSTSKYFSQTDYQNGIVGIPCAKQNNNNVITKHMRKRYWNSFEEMKLIEYWRRFSKEITTFQHQIPAFRKINDLMRQSGIHITPQECRRKILALKNKFYAEKERAESDDNTDWSLYPILHATICLDLDEQNLYAEEETIMNYVNKLNSAIFKTNTNISQSDKEKIANFEPKMGTAAWRMIRDGPKSIYNVPFLLEWEKERVEINESISKETPVVSLDNKPPVTKRSYRRKTVCSDFTKLSNSCKSICLREIIEENDVLNQNLENDRLRLQKLEAEFDYFLMVINTFILNSIGPFLMKRDSTCNVSVTQQSNDIVNMTSTKEFANITEAISIIDATVSTYSGKNDHETVGSDTEMMKVSSSSTHDSDSSSDSDEISNINNKNNENSQDVIILPSDFKIDGLTDPLEEYTKRFLDNNSSIWNADKENLEASGSSSLSEHKQRKDDSVVNLEFDNGTNQESLAFGSQHSNGSLHDGTMKLDEMNVSSDNDSDEDGAEPGNDDENVQPSTSEKSRQLHPITEVKTSPENISKSVNIVELSSSAEKENTNSSSTTKVEEDVEEITYFDLSSDDDYDMSY
ncbi:uncharacterized protein LOC119689490 [Teleopsis dalmanni]|uniref:uncharacterized protein LOC119689490 n=1 Tax=Teleopsis dalmanni TaxID=139649 RepID=UPI0018CFDC0D|nr:uncharacterized protein LOC119689490 [Teleopsis dalmanni]